MAKPTKLTPDEEIEKLKAELERLQGELADAAAYAAYAAERASYFSAPNTETPSGRTIKVRRCTNPWEKNESAQVWEEKDEPTYLFRVEMPPVGGWQILLDGEPLQQGQTYEVTMDRLRGLKEFIYRLQAHDASIHGSDEDNFRPSMAKSLSPRGGVTHFMVRRQNGIPV